MWRVVFPCILLTACEDEWWWKNIVNTVHPPKPEHISLGDLPFTPEQLERVTALVTR